MDWCGNHGTWMDSDELEEIADYILAGGLQKAVGAEGVRLSPDPDRMRALYESEKLIAGERAKSARTRRKLGTEEDGVLRTLGDFLSALLDH